MPAPSGQDHMLKNIFGQVYNTYSKIVYGIAIRISNDTALSEKILAEVFTCLASQGLLIRESILQPRHVFEATFRCIRTTLNRQFGEEEIQKRIAAVMHGMGSRSRGRVVTV